MGSKALRSLRRNLEEAAAVCRLNYGELARKRGIRDFLLDVRDGPEDPRDLVAAALESLTEGDRSAMDTAVCAAAVGCLIECLGVPASWDRARCLRDLAQLVTARASRAQYRVWAVTWYD